MQVFEEVVFTNTEGDRLETEALTWAQDSDKVYTDKPVKVVRGGDIIFGRGLDANEDFSRYTVRRITGTLQVPEGDTLVPDAAAQ
jgi:LPS export ABC transporter protein LptC